MCCKQDLRKVDVVVVYTSDNQIAIGEENLGLLQGLCMAKVEAIENPIGINSDDPYPRIQLSINTVTWGGASYPSTHKHMHIHAFRTLYSMFLELRG